jgi:hypothetical protein
MSAAHGAWDVVPDKDSVELYTPRAIRELLPIVDLDPCAEPGRRTPARRHLVGLEGADGLTASWAGARSAYVNPPWHRDRGGIGAWTQKIGDWLTAGGGELGIACIPARPGSAYWRRDVWALQATVAWLGRIVFEWGPNGEPTESGGMTDVALVVWLSPTAAPESRRECAALLDRIVEAGLPLTVGAGGVWKPAQLGLDL